MNHLLAMRAFACVVETGSFSRAADRLGIPRSTVSKLIYDLEAHLGSKLMHRTTRSVSTTLEGQQYYSGIVRLISDLDEMETSLKGNKLKPSGHLRVEAPAVFANSILIPALPEFANKYPEISVSLGVSDRPADIIGEGVDCAIRGGIIQDESLIGRKLAELDYVTCASPEYLKRYGLPLEPSNLGLHKLVGYFFSANGKAEPMTFIRDGEALRLDKFNYAANDGNGIVQLTTSGLGIGQPLRQTVSSHLEEGKLIEVLSKWHRPRLPLYLIYPSNRNPSVRLKVFIDWALSRFGANP